MIARVVVVIVVFAALAALAWWLEQRRRRDAPTQAGSLVPAQVDRSDFTRAETPWLVVLFTSRTCESCRGLYEKAAALASDDVAVVEVEYPGRHDLHERYRIDAAPMTLVVDADGVVRASFIGAFVATDLWSTLADLRAG